MYLTPDMRPVPSWLVACSKSSGIALGSSVNSSTLLVDLWCPVGYVPHVLLGHVLPLVGVIALSALIGGRLLTLRSEPLPEAREVIGQRGN